MNGNGGHHVVSVPEKLDPHRSLLDKLVHALGTWRNHKRLSGRTEAPDFSMFRFCDTNELGLSRIIAWMLDPQEDHDQGSAFLEAFVDLFGVIFEDRECLRAALVTVEAATDLITASRRRIDIEVNCGSFMLGIENKPFAGFQPLQIADYCAQLAMKSQNNFALVILKGWPGKTPADQLRFLDGRQCHVIDSDYRQLQLWVRRCKETCQAPAVRQFLMHFETFIDEEIVTGMASKEEGIVLKTVGVDREQLLAALDLIAAAPSLYEQLHGAFVSEIRALLRPGWRASTDGSERERKISRSTYYLTIDFDPASPVVFACDMYDGAQHANLAIRERLQERSPKRKLDRIRAGLQQDLPGFEYPGSSWLWWANSHSLGDKRLLDLEDDNIWKAIVDPQAAAEQIVGFAAKLEAAVLKASGPVAD
jgi:hypothetical protein